MRNITMLTAVAAFTVSAGIAGAQTVFEHLPTQETASGADSSGVFAQFRHADLFTLNSDANIGSVEYWGTYLNDQIPDSFTIEFYADAGGTLGSLLSTETVGAVSVVATGTIIGSSFDEYHYTADLAVPFSASANTGYYIKVTNDTNGASSNNGWFWEYSSTTTGGQVSDDFGATWGSVSNGYAFRLNTVPSPASATLLGIGGIAAMRRRR